MIPEVFIQENWFFMVLGLVWILGAVVQDLKKLEVANWWNFSLIVIALAYRAFLSVDGNWGYFNWGLIGLAGGFILANIFYYSRMFAGGDAKLMIALGPILPLSLDWQLNLAILVVFLIVFLLAGSIYGGLYSIYLATVNNRAFRRRFTHLLKGNKSLVVGMTLAALIVFIVSLFFNSLIISLLALLVLAAPWLLVYAKAVEDSCLVKNVSTKELVVGDWLVSPVKVGRKGINPSWEGLSEDDLKALKGYKRKVIVKYGIPFTPSFLLAFIGTLVLLWVI